MNNNTLRLGIFVFFDPQGIVDDYVLHLMRALRPHFSRFVAISNTELNHVAKERLEQYSDDLLIRENCGLDAAAFKDGLVSFCGWDEVEKYDEVVLLNDTYFGPIHSFGDMFEEMESRDLDFWGMSAGYNSVDGWNRVQYGYIPDHIQTFFTAFRKSMVCSEAFHSYWDHYDDTLNDFVSVVTQHEVVMTKHFQDLGFRWDIYADTQRYRSQHHSENFNIYYYRAHAMMRNMRFPVLKKKTLCLLLPGHFNMQDLEDVADALSYIQKETDYDTKLIWDNMLRLYNVTDLYQSLHLNYVLPSVPADMPADKKTALVYHIVNPFFAEPFCRHADRFQNQVDIYVIPEDEQAEAIVRQQIGRNSRIKVLNTTHQKTEMGSFVLRCKELSEQYDYLGFVHDALNPEHYSLTAMESSVYGYLQNIANDPAYLSQVINCFEENPRLGVLGTPFPIHLHGFSSYGNEWAGCFNAVKALADELELKCRLEEGKLPFMITGAFWCRTDAIRSLWQKEWTADQFCLNSDENVSANDVLRRILPFAAQSALYYSGIVMHTNYASMRITGQQYMLDQIVTVTRQSLNCTSEFYAGYIHQLQSELSRRTDIPETVVLSHFRFRNIVRFYLEQHTPKWFSSNIYRVYIFFKNLMSRSHQTE